MKMKKFLAMLLALTMLLLLIGCKKTDTSVEKTEPEPVFEESDEEKSLMFTAPESKEDPAEESEEPAGEDEEPAETEETEGEEPAEQEPVKEAPNEEAEEAPAEESSVQIEMGSWNGYTFENASLGYGVELDASWYAYSEEEILQANSLTIDQFDDESIKQQLANSDMFCDMIAQKLDGTAFIQVNVENLGVLYGSLLTVDDYIDISMSKLEPALLSAGYASVTTEKVTVTIDGKELPAIAVSGVFSGIDVYQLMIPVKSGDRIVCIGLSTYMTDTTSDYLNCIYLLQ